MTRSDLDPVLEWIKAVEATSVSPSWVPGATDDERRHLGALAAVARELVDDPSSRPWPADVLKWIMAAPAIPEDVKATLGSQLDEGPDSALAELYARIVRNDHRRVLGTFFTPAAEVDLMIEMWSSSQPAPDEVVDVGAGVGIFTAAALRKWPTTSVSAVDVNPVTLGLLAAQLTSSDLPDAEDMSSRLRIVLDDYTSWLPKSKPLGKRRLILGNPPYTRWQLIAPGDRKRMVEEAGGLCTERASLSALITAISVRNLRPQDGICFLLPAHWLESDYAADLRRHLSQLSKRRIELRVIESQLFDDAQVDAVVLLVGAEEPSDISTITFGEWGRAVENLVPRKDLVGRNWRHLFAGTDVPISPSLLVQEKDRRVPLDHLGRVRRGVATGANEFFLLNDEALDATGIDSAAVQPTVRRLGRFPDRISQTAFDALGPTERRWLLVVGPDMRAENAAVDRYLKDAEAAGLYPERELCRRRKDWYDLAHDVVVPDVVIGAMSRSRNGKSAVFRVVDNEIGAIVTNNLYGWKWNSSISSEVRLRVVNWLRSHEGQEQMRLNSRRQADQLLKIEPRSLGRIQVPESII